MKLPEARRMAERIVAELSPLCERIEVAGSVRRGRPEVGDLDFAVLVAPGQRLVVRERAIARATIVKDGEDVLIVRLAGGMQADFYFARPASADLLQPIPGNWGTVLLCRTGSKEHNIHLAQTARRQGLQWETMTGITLTQPDGSREVLASETEEDIFRTLGLDYVAPERRER